MLPGAGKKKAAAAKEAKAPRGTRKDKKDGEENVAPGGKFEQDPLTALNPKCAPADSHLPFSLHMI